MNSVSKKTGEGFQSSLFLKQLRNELGRLTDLHRELYSAASDYSDQGVGENEMRELLVIDGFDSEAVETYLFSSHICQDSGIRRWSFSIKSADGNVITDQDLNIEVLAENESDAKNQIDELIESGSDAGFEALIELHESEE